MLQELPYEKRDGAKVADVFLFDLAFDAEKSTSEACSLLRSLEFTPAVAQALKDDPQGVITKLEEARKYREFRILDVLHVTRRMRCIEDW